MAKDTIADLSDFLREILYSGEENEIPLGKELRTLEYYLNILNVRFSDHLFIRKEIDQELMSSKVPPLSCNRFWKIQLNMAILMIILTWRW